MVFTIQKTNLIYLGIEREGKSNATFGTNSTMKLKSFLTVKQKSIDLEFTFPVWNEINAIEFNKSSFDFV